MAHQQSPTNVSPFLDRPGLDPGPAPEPNLHLLGGHLWVASCPTCGLELARARTQERCERRAAGRTCPICRGGDAA
jgi:hypothetical protein